MATFYRGYDKTVAIGFYTKEATYDAGMDLTTTDNSVGCRMQSFESAAEWADEIISDKEDIGQEHGTTQEIFNHQAKYTYTETKARPNSLAGLATMAFGSVSSEANANGGYIHTITPCATTADLPSTQIDEKFGGVRYQYKGMVADTLKITGEAGRMIGLEATLMGSGTRTTSTSTSFPATVSESWMKAYQTKIFFAAGDTITVAASPTQESTTITGSDTSEEWGLYLNSFEYNWTNNLEGRFGFGSQVFQQIDYKKRNSTLSLTLMFRNSNEYSYFLNQTPMAIEIECAGGLIDSPKTAKYGFKLIIPQFKIKAAPLPTGGVSDFLTCTFDCEIFDDETNDVGKIIVYNNIAAYLA